LDLGNEISGGEKYTTDYITSIALYPYEVASNQVSLELYCLKTQGDWCVEASK